MTTRRDWSLEAIDKYAPKGGTALYDAVYDALTRLRGIEGRRVVVVMTDGRDENNPGTGPGSVHTFEQVLERLKSVDATVFPVGLGAQIDRPVLEQLARASGGEAYFPQDVSTLGRDFNRILETLRRRYVVSYTCTNSTRDGAWRKVDIRSRSTASSSSVVAATSRRRSSDRMVSDETLRRVLPAGAVALLGDVIRALLWGLVLVDLGGLCAGLPADDPADDRRTHAQRLHDLLLHGADGGRRPADVRIVAGALRRHLGRRSSRESQSAPCPVAAPAAGTSFVPDRAVHVRRGQRGVSRLLARG